ncbi:relaxase/mobilization nuclease domain-containing protein [Hymenobacter defluvii]|uniref:Relaxase/mobilization nuclease domain-containing protein n=1 Tax=Hymenobacter defluvii TaxID=2054411 RepID=A0ABS3THK6_9BACT|nr:relaxase/mobilization nuclease domain-containing protein [Hymenobacter defluvii]MBO3273123.1 relaxase/mobilization nuclease domain-containing protein [Hymenobacter defluvii]
MIAKTNLGADFEGAIAYGQGIRSGRTNKQASLVSVANIYSEDPKGIAGEMRDVASLSEKIQKPVWHTVLSWAPGEEVTLEQKRQAAALYCELIGATLDRHQVAVYEHKDKPHAHLHIYINRVPIDGGPALRSDQNYARNVKATQQIREKLGMAPLPERRQSLKDHSPEKEATRELVQAALATALRDKQVTTVEQLQQVLQQQSIQTQIRRDEQGILTGVSFRAGQTAVTGTQVGYKGQQLRDHFAQEPKPALRSQRSQKAEPGTGQARSNQPGQRKAAHPTSSDADRQAAREYVNGSLTTALQDKQLTTLDALTVRLREQGIVTAFKRDEKGILVGSAFRYGEVMVKGTEVGFKAKQLRDHFADEPQPAQRTPAARATEDAAGPGIATQGPARGSQPDSVVGELGELIGALGQGASNDGAGDEARDNENEIKQRRRRRPKL